MMTTLILCLVFTAYLLGRIVMNQNDLRDKLAAVDNKLDGIVSKIQKLKDSQGAAQADLVAAVQATSDKVDAIDASLPA